MLYKILPFLLCQIILAFAHAEVSSGAAYESVYVEYPKDRFLVGIGETRRTGNLVNDRRVAEVFARLEIARQIKVRLKEETVDIMCEGGAAKLFKDILQCRNEFIMVVEVTVDEFLEGSRIVTHGENEATAYAVAVMPKADAGKDLDKRAGESAEKTRENIEKAKKGDKEAAQDAQKEYMKALTYDREKQMVDGVRSRASEMFEDLENELAALEGEQ